MNYVLDAGPMIAFLMNAAGAEVVENLLTEPVSECFAHVYNLCEVYYIYYRRHGLAAAKAAIRILKEAGITIRDDIDEEFWQAAAAVKGSHTLALPDAFCLALADRIGGTVVTTDHNEFDPLASLGLGHFLFIR